MLSIMVVVMMGENKFLGWEVPFKTIGKFYDGSPS